MDESEIQESFIDWIVEEYKYTEVISDPNGGAGAICDSIGWIKKVPYLIEFKCKIIPSIIQYSRQKSSSIERKIQNTLKKLHAGDFLEWNKESIPYIWLIAENINKEAIYELDCLLSKRSKDWCFQYEYGVWSGSKYICLKKGPTSPLSIVNLNNINFPPMEWPGENRKPRRNIETFKDIALKNQVSNLFNYLLDLIYSHNLSIKCNRESLNIVAFSKSEKIKINFMSIWPSDSGTYGLCIATDESLLQQCFPERNINIKKPGVPAKNRGFLGPRVFLKNIDEIKTYWEWATGIQIHI